MTSKRYRKLLMASGLADRNLANSHIGFMKRLWYAQYKEAKAFSLVRYFNGPFCYRDWYDAWSKSVDYSE